MTFIKNTFLDSSTTENLKSHLKTSKINKYKTVFWY